MTSSFEITSQGDHALIHQTGRLANVADARKMQREIVERCLEWGVRRAVFDNRATIAPDDEVRELMWEWLVDVDLERVALLLESPMAVVRANMTALAKGLKVRAFAELDEARAWLKG